MTTLPVICRRFPLDWLSRRTKLTTASNSPTYTAKVKP